MEWPDFILPIIYLALISVAILKFRFFRLEGLPAWMPLVAFWLKAASGLGLFLLYSHYYPDRSNADIFRFYDDALKMWELGRTDWQNFLSMLSGIGDDNNEVISTYLSMDNWYRAKESFLDGNARSLIRFHALALLFSGGNYHVHYLLASILSFSGAVLLWRGFNMLDPRHSLPAFFAIFLLPSMLLWTSGVLKESFLFLALGLLFFGFSRWIQHGFHWKHLAFFMASGILFLLIRPWIGILALLMAALFMTIGKRSLKQQLIVLGLIASLLFAANAAGIGLLPEIIQEKQQQFLSLRSDSGFENMLTLPTLDASLFAPITALPQALYNVFLQPNPFNAESLFEFLCAVEMLFLISAMIFLIFRFIKPESSAIWLFLLLTSFLALIIIGITVPYSGAIVRYRSILMPLLMLALLHSSAFACPLMRRLNRGM
jgi:hypothetical protein